MHFSMLNERTNTCDESLPNTVANTLILALHKIESNFSQKCEYKADAQNFNKFTLHALS